MPDKFVEPFAHGATRRRPTASERLNGFACGPLDRQLFNWLHWIVQSELGHLIEYAGLSDTTEDRQQVRKAVEALISSASGGGDTSQFVLFNQARSRLPIYPEVVSSDHKINVISPTGGQVQVPTGVTIRHRGIWNLSTSDFSEGERTFSTEASKTYHLRLALSPGSEALSLEDLDDSGYNPGEDDEDAVVFATGYDDMLIATISTDGGNDATITPHVNNGRWPTRDGLPWWCRLDNRDDPDPQVIPDDAVTKVTEMPFDQGNASRGMWDNGRFTVDSLRAGLWAVQSRTNLGGELGEWQAIYRNGELWSGTSLNANAGSSNVISHTTFIPLAAEDYIEFYVRHESGEGKTLNTGDQSAHVVLTRLY